MKQDFEFRQLMKHDDLMRLKGRYAARMFNEFYYAIKAIQMSLDEKGITTTFDDIEKYIRSGK